MREEGEGNGSQASSSWNISPVGIPPCIGERTGSSGGDGEMDGWRVGEGRWGEDRGLKG